MSYELFISQALERLEQELVNFCDRATRIDSDLISEEVGKFKQTLLLHSDFQRQAGGERELSEPSRKLPPHILQEIFMRCVEACALKKKK